VLVLVFVAHFAGGANWTLSNFALQSEVPDRLRGRVFAIDLMIVTLSIAISQLVATAFVDRVDERVILAGCGLVTLVYGIVWGVATRKLRLGEQPSVVGGRGSEPGGAGGEHGRDQQA
jgi:MFS family permease